LGTALLWQAFTETYQISFFEFVFLESTNEFHLQFWRQFFWAVKGPAADATDAPQP
jgi:hypothetical protein